MSKRKREQDSKKQADFFFSRGLKNIKSEEHQFGLIDHLAAIQTYPEFSEKSKALAYNNLGVACIRQGEFHKAVEVFDQSILLYDDLYVSYSNKGVALIELGLLDEAKDSFNLSILLHPENSLAHCGLGIAQLRLKEYDNGYSSIQTALKYSEDNEELQNECGRLISQYYPFTKISRLATMYADEIFAELRGSEFEFCDDKLSLG